MCVSATNQPCSGIEMVGPDLLAEGSLTLFSLLSQPCVWGSRSLLLETTVRDEVIKNALEFGVGLFRKHSFFVDGFDESGVLSSQVFEVHFFELGDLLSFDLV